MADITIIKAKLGHEEEKGLDTYLKEEAFNKEVKNTRELFSALQEELDSREEDLKDGLSFLDLKNDTLLSYMIDVCNIILQKVRGETIEGHRSIERCVEYRVILEKIKAIDQKLAYQLNKLITMPDDAEEEEQGINVGNLDVNVEGIESDSDQTDDESEAFSEEEQANTGDEANDEELSDASTIDQKKVNAPTVKSSGVYKPPKLRSVAYHEKGRRKNYDDIYKDDDTADFVDEPHGRRVDEERVRFEEDNYTRLPEENPKKTKRKLKTKEYRRKGKGFKRRRK